MIEKFRALGWSGPLQGSDHAYMVKGKQKQRIPNDHGGDISDDLESRILRQADIDKASWLNA